MSDILITGGTGRLGKALSRLFSERGIDRTLASRRKPAGKDNWVFIDLLRKQGIEQAVEGKKIIFHLAHDLKSDSTVTQNLLDALKGKPGIHLIYISIVGIDAVPMKYYREKLKSEQAIAGSGVAYSILRATQFHQYAEYVISSFLRFPVCFLPKKVLVQPVQVEVVARELFHISQGAPLNGIRNIGGSEVLTLGEMAKLWLKATKKKRIILPLPLRGAVGKALREGGLTWGTLNPESISWEEWLKKKYSGEKGSLAGAGG